MLWLRFVESIEPAVITSRIFEIFRAHFITICSYTLDVYVHIYHAREMTRRTVSVVIVVRVGKYVLSVVNSLFLWYWKATVSINVRLSEWLLFHIGSHPPDGQLRRKIIDINIKEPIFCQRRHNLKTARPVWLIIFFNVDNNSSKEDFYGEKHKNSCTGATSSTYKGWLTQGQENK